MNKELLNSLKNHVKILSSQIGDRNTYNYKNLVKAEKYIKKVFKKYGYNPSAHRGFSGLTGLFGWERIELQRYEGDKCCL